jgi:hypothetical protein
MIWLLIISDGLVTRGQLTETPDETLTSSFTRQLGVCVWASTHHCNLCLASRESYIERWGGTHTVLDIMNVLIATDYTIFSICSQHYSQQRIDAEINTSGSIKEQTKCVSSIIEKMVEMTISVYNSIIWCRFMMWWRLVIWWRLVMWWYICSSILIVNI